MAEPIVNPGIPYVGEVPGGLQPGKMIRIQGITHPNSDRFNINLATGPIAKPRDDTSLHLSVRLNQGYVARNSYKDGGWGDEQGSGKLPIGNSQRFEIIVLIDPSHYKIAINGQHFCEFPHRVPFQEVSHLLIDGDVSITLISFEEIAIPGGITSSQASQVHAEGPQGTPQFGGPQYGPPPGNYGPPPPNYGGYGPPPPPGAFKTISGVPAMHPKLPSMPINPVALSYPTPKPIGLVPPKSGTLHHFGPPLPCQPAVPQSGYSQPSGGHPYPVQHTGDVAKTMYPVQPVGFAGYPFSTAHGHSKEHKKLKKAMKYGLPIAGTGVAVYAGSKASKKSKKAVKKGFNCSKSSGSSSSSSSSSSSD